MKKTTFGSELVRLRRTKPEEEPFTQRDFAEAIGVSRSTVVSWENDIRIPILDQFNKISTVLNLTIDEDYYLRGLAGYIPPTRIPLTDFVKEIEKQERVLRQYDYPGYVLDMFNHHFWLVNPAAIALFGDALQNAQLKDLMPLSLFEAMLSHKFKFRSDLVDVESVLKEVIRRFMVVNKKRWHEYFYMQYPEKIRGSKHLTPTEKNEFIDIWKSITTLEDPSEDLFTGYGGIQIKMNGGTFAFTVRGDNPRTPLGADLYQTVFYEPSGVTDQIIENTRRSVKDIASKDNKDDMFRLWDNHLEIVSALWKEDGLA